MTIGGLISLDIGLDLFYIVLIYGACGTSRAMPFTLQASILRVCATTRICFWLVGLDPMG